MPIYIDFPAECGILVEEKNIFGGIYMPILDMPLSELRTYEGTNPKPADFDEFWDRSLAEMRAIDPKAELVPSEF